MRVCVISSPVPREAQDWADGSSRGSELERMGSVELALTSFLRWVLDCSSVGRTGCGSRGRRRSGLKQNSNSVIICPGIAVDGAGKEGF